jgi:hypothetical protein
MTKLNKALMASTAIAFATGLAMPASAQDPSAAPGVVSSQKKIKVNLYGQISRIFGFVGDGESVTFKQGANASTSTRMGIDGRGKVNNDISLRTRFEFQLQSGDTGGGSQFVNQGGSSSRLAVRHLDVILSSKKFGAVWMGRGDSSSNGTSEISTIPGDGSARLGGVAVNGLEKYRVMDKNSALGTQAVATVERFFDNFDGANRQNRLRYDTPTFFGFKGSVSLIDKHNIDSAIWYSGKFAGTQIKGAVGYCHTKGTQSAGSGTCFANGTTTSGIDQLNGSFSVLTPIGIGGGFSGGTQWQERTAAGASTNENPYNLSPSIFYTTKFTELGATAFEYAFQYTENGRVKGDKGYGHSVIAMQKVDSIGGHYFVTFRYVDVETATNSNLEPLWYFGGGFRQRF